MSKLEIFESDLNLFNISIFHLHLYNDLNSMRDEKSN